MWIKDVLNVTKEMRTTIRSIEKASREKDSDAVEELAKDLEGQAGSLVAAMQIEGIWVGIKIGDGIAEGQFPDHSV